MRVWPDDLTQSRLEWVAWWPPSMQLLLWPLRSLGLNPGDALRVLTLGAVALGSSGWATWFRRFGLPPAWTIFYAVTIPFIRYSSVNFFRYSAEALAFAVAPWILILSACLLRSMRDRSRAAILWALLSGIVAASTYWLKYSLFVTAIAALGGACIWILRFRRPGLPRNASALALALAVAGLGPLSLRLFYSGAGVTPLSHPPAHFDMMGIIYAISNPALAAADAFGPLFVALVFPGIHHLGTHSLDAVAWIAAPAGLLSLYLILSAVLDPDVSESTWIGSFTLFITCAFMLGLWSIADVDHTARLFCPAALGALPIILSSGRDIWARLGSALRLAFAGALAVFVLTPLVFGPFYVALKVRDGLAMKPGPDGLGVPKLTLGNSAALQAALDSMSGPDAVWVVADPEVALELPGRSIWMFAGHSIAEDLQNVYLGRNTLDQWRTSRPVRLLVLLPSSDGFDNPPRLLQSDRKVQNWERKLLPDPALILWAGILEPDEQMPQMTRIRASP